MNERDVQLLHKQLQRLYDGLQGLAQGYSRDAVLFSLLNVTQVAILALILWRIW